MSISLKTLIPYILILILGGCIYFGFVYYSNKIETLTQCNTMLETKNAQIEENNKTLQSLYDISINQLNELMKNQKESLDYVNELDKTISGIDFNKIFDNNKDEMIKQINAYEECYSVNVIKNPSYKCYGESNGK
jgi:hypothetical protein